MLGESAKWRKASISFAMSFRPSFRTYQLGTHCTDFREIWYCKLLWKSVENIQISLKSDKNSGYSTWGPTYICFRRHKFASKALFCDSQQSYTVTDGEMLLSNTYNTLLRNHWALQCYVIRTLRSLSVLRISFIQSLPKNAISVTQLHAHASF